MVGIGILPAAVRNVAFAAMEVATLAQLFPGRLVVGLGHGMPGWMRAAGAWPASPLTLLREHAVALRDLLHGRAAVAGGTYVRLDGVVLEEVPEVVPPVLLGVRGPRSLELAGRVADGILLAEPAHPTYIRAAREQAGLAGGREGEVVVYDVAAVADNGRAARDAVRPALQWIGDPDWAPHLAALPFAAELAALRARAASREEFAAALPDEWVAELAVAGTVEQAAARIRERHDAGATCVVLAPAGPNPLRRLEDLGRLVDRQR